MDLSQLHTATSIGPDDLVPFVEGATGDVVFSPGTSHKLTLAKRELAAAKP